MNILQIVPELKSGGVERGTVDFAKYLLAQGHRSVIASNGGPLVTSLLDSGVVHYELPVHRKSFFSVLRCVREISAIIRKEQIDLVHARSRVPAWIATLACRRERIPFVTTCHGVYGTHLLSRVMGWGKIVISISHAVSVHMKERFGVPYHRLRLIHRGVNLAEFTHRAAARNPAEGPRVVIVGRITPIKGHAVLFKAIARVARLFPQVRLLVVGEAPKSRYQEELRMLAERIGIQDRVEFLGTRYDVADLLKKTDLLVAPAVGEEAFGRVIIEAGACGVPVIASRIGGIVDILEDGVDGILVPAGDVVRLGEAITEVLRNPARAARMAEALRSKVETLFSDRKMFEETLGVYREAVEKKKILVIKFSALGDVVLSVPSFRAIRRKFPNAGITAVVERASRSILRNCPFIDDIIAVEEARGPFRWAEMLRLGNFLAKEHFDICVDLQNSRSSHLLAYLSGAHTRIGYANGKFSFLLNSAVRDAGFPMSPVEHQFQALKLLGFSEMDKGLELWTQPEDDATIDRFLAENWLREEQVLVGVNPASSKKWPTKQWPVERFIELCDVLSKHNIRVVLTGDRSAEEVGRAIETRTKSKPINAISRTSVGELVALVRRCNVFLTSDSAPMHVAAAVGTPFVALFGPTDPRRHAVAALKSTIIRKDLKCSPCYLRACPIGHLCMKRITKEEVFAKIMEWIEKNRSPESATPAAV